MWKLEFWKMYSDKMSARISCSDGDLKLLFLQSHDPHNRNRSLLLHRDLDTVAAEVLGRRLLCCP